MHARDKLRTRRKTSFSISLPSSKLTISTISIYKHYAIDIADPSTMQEACHTRTSLSVESLWLSGRASERGIRTSEVRFLMRNQNLFFVPRSRHNEIHLSPFLYLAQNEGLIIPLLFSVFSILILVCELHPTALSVYRIHHIGCTRKTKTTRTKPFKCYLRSFVLENSLLQKSNVTNVTKKINVWIVQCG